MPDFKDSDLEDLPKRSPFARFVIAFLGFAAFAGFVIFAYLVTRN